MCSGGATAIPTCEFSSTGKPPPDYCGLRCKNGEKCPTGTTCEMPTGICAYPYPMGEPQEEEEEEEDEQLVMAYSALEPQPEALNSTAASSPSGVAAHSAAMEDLLGVGEGAVTCPDGKSSCPFDNLCVCDRSHHCVACLTHAASLNHGEVAAVGAIAQILESKFVRLPNHFHTPWLLVLLSIYLRTCVPAARTSTASLGQRAPCRTSSTRTTTTTSRRTATWRRIWCMA